MEHILSSPAGVNPPEPVDAGVSVLFNTGSKTGVNRIILRMRETVEDFLTMVDLNDMEQGELNDNPQPDVGISKWDPRDIGEFEGDDISTLEGMTMEDLERTEDLELAAWFGVILQWSSTTTISALDSEGNGNSYSAPVLAANTRYLFRVDLEENSFRAKIFNIDDDGLTGTEVYDTTAFIDDFIVVRRKGWLRWSEEFDDNDADVIEIRTHSLTFAEYRSQPLKSVTPVEGATLSAEFSPAKDRFTGVEVGPSGGTVVPDTSKALSQESFKITNTGNLANQGIVSNLINFQDFRNTRIEFDIFYPRAALEAGNDVKLILRSVNLDGMVPATNFVPNPSFELNTTGWSTAVPAHYLNTGATLTRITSQQKSGEAAAQVVTTAASAFQGIAANLGVLAAGTYLFSSWVKAATAGGTLQVFGGHATAADEYTEHTLTTGWVRVSGTFVADGIGVVYIGNRTNSAVALTWYADAFMVTSAD